VLAYLLLELHGCDRVLACIGALDPLDDGLSGRTELEAHVVLRGTRSGHPATQSKVGYAKMLAAARRERTKR
jgi:hypothetical protein